MQNAFVHAVCCSLHEDVSFAPPNMIYTLTQLQTRMCHNLTVQAWLGQPLVPAASWRCICSCKLCLSGQRHLHDAANISGLAGHLLLRMHDMPCISCHQAGAGPHLKVHRLAEGLVT